MKKKTLLAFTLSLFMSCLLMLSAVNTASAEARQYVISDLVGDYEVVYAGEVRAMTNDTSWEASDHYLANFDPYSKDIGAIVRVELIPRENNKYNTRDLVGYIIKDIAGSANTAGLKVDPEEGFVSAEKNGGIFSIMPTDLEFTPDVETLTDRALICSRNDDINTYGFFGMGVNYERVGDYLNFYDTEWMKDGSQVKVYILKLRRTN